MLKNIEARETADTIHANFATSMGDFSVLLHHKQAPKTCQNFIDLAEGTETGSPFYNGLVFGLFNVVQIIAMLSLGMFTTQRFLEGCLALIPLFIFQFLGMRVMGYASPKVFTGAVVAVIVLMEIKLVWEGLGL